MTATRLLALILMPLACLLAASDTHVGRELGSTTSPYGYVEYLPGVYHDRSPGETFPLVVFLHGLGEQGNGTTQLWNAITKHGPHKLIKNGSTLFADNGVIVCSPQSAVWWNTGNLKTYIDYLIDTYDVDTDRIYVTGISMGGGGTWQLVKTYPDSFAACIPICGAAGAGNGTPFVDVPTWAFHAWGDGTVSRNNSIGWCNNIAGAILGTSATNLLANYPHAGGVTSQPAAETKTGLFNGSWTWASGVDATDDAHPKLTFYTDGSHDSWTRTYNNTAVWDWLFRKRRGGSLDAPTATITSPTADSASDIGATVTFSGSASDPEDGNLTGTALAWTSNKDGALGTGTSLALSSLSAGRHRITLTATDSDGKTGVATIDIIVVDDSPFEILVDFGASDRQTGGNWNNITDYAAGLVTDAVAADGSTTTVAVRITDDFQGQNSNGMPSTALFPSPAVEDTFWVQPGSNEHAEVVISGLSSKLVYDLRCFASRDATGTRVTVYGIGTDTATLDVIDNVDRIAGFTGLSPDSNGQLTLTIDAQAGSAYGYLGVLRLVGSEPVVPVSGRRVSIGSSAGETLVVIEQDGAMVSETTGTSHQASGLATGTDITITLADGGNS